MCAIGRWFGIWKKFSCAVAAIFAAFAAGVLALSRTSVTAFFVTAGAVFLALSFFATGFLGATLAFVFGAALATAFGAAFEVAFLAVGFEVGFAFLTTAFFDFEAVFVDAAFFTFAAGFAFAGFLAAFAGAFFVFAILRFLLIKRFAKLEEPD
ncbi:MAG TPA: hypothetical protein VD927_17680 [Chryseosolibacter sp.]|nr:hypothetical protein [Chryseosolibacter sp.]